MDVARLNFSHGTHADHERMYQLVREAAAADGRAVGILADLQGPKIRLGRFADPPVDWQTGDRVVITSDDVLGTAERVSCTYRRLPQEVKPGDRLLIDDGKVILEVAEVDGPDVGCRVLEGGLVSNHKGVSLPHVGVTVPALSEKDIGDLRFALRLGADLVALSFVRSPDEAKPVIVATQMLDSMIESSRPTRAEASDVANAVLDGADALMLSGETSVGSYPVLSVATMARIIETTERGPFSVPRLQHDPRTRGGAITSAAAGIAQAIGAKALVAFTETGDTVRRLARLHCQLPLIAFTPHSAVRSQLTVSWGVETFLVPFVEHTDDMFRQVDQALIGMRGARRGDDVVIVAGSPPGTPGSTNTLRVHRLGSLADAV